jgi:hypothetical protein
VQLEAEVVVEAAHKTGRAVSLHDKIKSENEDHRSKTFIDFAHMA